MDASMPSTLRLLAVPLALAVFLLAVSSAHATPIGTAAVPLAFEEELEFEGEGEEGEFELEACEAAEEEVEEGELDEAAAAVICDEADDENGQKAGGSGSVAPEECLLRSVHGHAAADAAGNKLKLTIGYTTYEPVTATIEVGQGPSPIASLHRRLGRSGTLRVVKSLHGDEAPRRVVVRIAISDAPRYCGKYLSEKIPVSEAGGNPAARHARHPRGR